MRGVKRDSVSPRELYRLFGIIQIDGPLLIGTREYTQCAAMAAAGRHFNVQLLEDHECLPEAAFLHRGSRSEQVEASI